MKVLLQHDLILQDKYNIWQLITEGNGSCKTFKIAVFEENKRNTIEKYLYLYSSKIYSAVYD